MNLFKNISRRALVLLMAINTFAVVGLTGCSEGSKPDGTNSSVRATVEKPEAKIKEATELHQKQMEANIESATASAPKP
jgi:hypothetical protein